MTDKIILPINEDLPLRDVVFQALRRAILSGQLQPGERLMEMHLAGQLGVSRTPVREAIRKLELEGLVNMVPHRGAVVAEISREDLEDVLEVRAALEELAVRKACRMMTDEQLRELKKAAYRFSESVQRGTPIQNASMDVELHEIISSATGNRRLIGLLNNLCEQIYRYRLEILKDRSTYSDLVKEHAALVDALVARDEDAAAEAIRVHIENQKRSIMESLHLAGK